LVVVARKALVVELVIDGANRKRVWPGSRRSIGKQYRPFLSLTTVTMDLIAGSSTADTCPGKAARSALGRAAQRQPADVPTVATF
jgi:hypothetical protein